MAPSLEERMGGLRSLQVSPPLAWKDHHPCTFYPRHHEAPTHYLFGHQLLGILEKEGRINRWTDGEGECPEHSSHGKAQEGCQGP